MIVRSTFLTKTDKVVHRLMSFIIILVTTMAACSMLLQVVARYIFEISISGLDEITGHIAVWLYLMGAANGSFEKTQIKAEMIHLFIKNKRILNCIRAMATTVGAVVAGYMVVWSYGYVRWSILKHEVTPTLQLPTVIFQFAILLGAALMVIYFVREAIDLAVIAYNAKPESE